jgi:hypothetical protein
MQVNITKRIDTQKANTAPVVVGSNDRIKPN